jgi:hypothetical protein
MDLLQLRMIQKLKKEKAFALPEIKKNSLYRFAMIFALKCTGSKWHSSKGGSNKQDF